MKKKSNSRGVRRILAWLPGTADSTKAVFSLVFLSLVFFPLIKMLANIDGESIRKVVQSPKFAESLLNSLFSTAIATVITILIAMAMATCLERINIKLRSIFSIIFVIPMLIPSISHGMGLVILFGNNGVLTNLLGLEFKIYGPIGIIFGAVLYAFPVAFLMLSDVLRYEDYSPYEAAEILGMSKLRQFIAITFPYLRKPMISVVFSTFTLIFTDYGVPLMVGGKFTTLPVVMYQEVIGQLDFGKGSVYGVVLLVPAIVAFVVDLINKDKGNSTYITKPCPRSNRRIHKICAYSGCAFVTLSVFLPIFSFVLLAFSDNYPQNTAFTFANFLKAYKLRAFEYLGNSIVIALMVSVFGVGIAFMTAYLSARMKSGMSRFLHLSSITSAAIPGIVLGLSYVLAFNGFSVYGTIFILAMVNIVHFIASPYLMIYNSLSKMNENLEHVAHTMGIYRLQMIRDVFIPLCKSTIIEMFSYFFVNCMVTISAVSFLATTANKPVSLMINQFEAQSQLECAAVVSLLILGVNLAVKGIAHFLKSKER